MGKIIRLTESDLIKIVKRVISEQSMEKKTFRQSKPRKVMDKTENDMVFEIYRLLVDNGFKQNFNNVSDVYVLGKNEFKKYADSWYTQDVSGPFKFSKGDMSIELNKRYADITVRKSFGNQITLDSSDPNTVKKIKNLIK
jgi:hypothetical protein